MNKITTYIGAAQRPITLILMFIIIEPQALNGLLSVTSQQYLMKIIAVIIAFIGFIKDTKMADAKTVTDLINAVPLNNTSPLAQLKEMKTQAAVTVSIILIFFFFPVGCTSTGGSNVITAVSSVIKNPALQQATLTAANIAAVVEPQYASLAPVAVQELIALTNGTNPIGVTGNVDQDVPALIETVSAMIPTNKGSEVATQIANAYKTAMNAPGMTQTPGTANAVLTAIATGLTK